MATDSGFPLGAGAGDEISFTLIKGLLGHAHVVDRAKQAASESITATTLRTG
jgi:hypothetical protein